jgi:hypothetical protein
MARRAIWKLDALLSKVESVELADTLVTVKGWDDRSSPVMCTYVFKFNEGVLADELDDRGCSK